MNSESYKCRILPPGLYCEPCPCCNFVCISHEKTSINGKYTNWGCPKCNLEQAQAAEKQLKLQLESNESNQSILTILVDLVHDFKGYVPGDHVLRLAERIGLKIEPTTWDMVIARALVDSTAKNGINWELEVAASLDMLGSHAIRVREGGGLENLAASLAATMARLDPRRKTNAVMRSRTFQDFAIEHAEYLATAAETFVEIVDNYDQIMLNLAKDVLDAEQQISETKSDRRRTLLAAIYEFRKRSARARSNPSDGERNAQ